MSNVIDSKVVEMKFDNTQFEQNVKTSMTTLDKLKQSLKLNGAEKSFSGISKAAKGIDLQSIASGVEALQKRFSTFGIIGQRVLQNLTDKAMHVGKKITSFVTEGIIQGGIRRAMNLENAHFQLQGLLKDEEQVNAVMQNVNDSVDGTAYSLDSAAKVASQFAASGMRAGDDMFHSLRAVAGVAAMTNSEYDQIGQIFTTVAGNGRLMGDQLLQLSSRGMNAAATLAEYLGKSETEVREMVSKGKIDFKTFADAMDDAFGEHAKKANETFTGAMSNIKAALARIGALFISPLIIQNGPIVQLFNTIREKINLVKKEIEPFAETFTKSINRMARTFRLFLDRITKDDVHESFQGLETIFKALKNTFQGFGRILDAVKKAFSDIFPPVTLEDFQKLSNVILELSKRFQIFVGKSFKDLRNSFRGLFAVIDIVFQALKAVWEVTKPLRSSLTGLISNILGVTGSFGKWLVELDKSIKENNTFVKAFEKVGDVFGLIYSKIEIVVDYLKQFVNVLKEKIAFPSHEVFVALLERIKERAVQVKNAFVEFKEKALGAFSSLKTGLQKTGFLDFLVALKDAAKIVGGGFVTGIGEVIGKLADGLSNVNFDGVIDLLNAIALGGISGAFIGSWGQITNTLFSLETAFKKISSGFGITAVLRNFKYTLLEYQKTLKAEMLLKIAKAIAILAASLVVMSLVDSEKLMASIAAMSVLFGELVGSMAILNSIEKYSRGIKKAGTLMLLMSTSILILAIALKSISGLSAEQFVIGITTIGILMAMLAGVATVLSSSERKVIKGAGSLLIFAAALKVMVSALLDISILDFSQVSVGIVGIGALLGEIAVFTKLLGNPKKMVSTGIALIAMGSAMKIFASVCSDLGRMPLDQIKQSLASIGIIFAEIAAFSIVTGKSKNILKIGISLIAVSAALEIIANVISKLGNLSWDEIARGLTAMGASLAEVAIALRIMKGTASGSASLLIASVALITLSKVLKTLGSLEWVEIAKGLIALAGAFTIIGVAALVLSPIIPAILGLAGALTLIGISVLALGVGVAAAGVGLMALAAGLTSLAALGPIAAASIVGSLAIIIEGFLNLIPGIIDAFGRILESILNVIIESAPLVGEAFVALLKSAIDSLRGSISAIGEGLWGIISDCIGLLTTYAPDAINKLLDLAIVIIDGFKEKTPILVEKISELIEVLMSSIKESFEKVNTTSVGVGIAGLVAMVIGLNQLDPFIKGAMKSVLKLGLLIAEIAVVIAAIGALSKIPGFQNLVDSGGEFLGSIGTAIGKFVGGIAGGAASEFSNQLPNIGNNLSSFMSNAQGFIDGAKNIDASVLKGVAALGAAIIIITGAEILNGIASWLTGGSSLSDFGAQLVPFGESMVQFSNSISGLDSGLITNAATAGKALAEMASTIPNSGGVVAFFTGENDMASFGNQLVPFGEAMQGFASSVAGLDSEAVTNAATAGKALNEMASTIPNSGGVVSFFTGNNDMEAFGEQLVPFGKAMNEFSSAVSGLDPEVITNSITAGKALIELAHTVPNSGGLVAFFTGNNDMDTFGTQIVPFGEAMKSYSEKVNGIDAAVVENSVVAGKAIVELANTIPNSGGLISFFTGNNDMATFSQGLVSFGEAMNSYSASVSGINPEALSGVITQANRLVNLAKGMADIDYSGMGGFGNGLKSLANNSIDGFIAAFDGSVGKVTSAIDGFLNKLVASVQSNKDKIVRSFEDNITASIKAINAKQQQFRKAGVDLMAKLISGIKSKTSEISRTIGDVITTVLNSINNKKSSFKSAGEGLISSFVSGISSNKTSISGSFSTKITSAISTINSYYTNFYNSGVNLVNGFAAGINGRAWFAASAATAMVNAAKNAANKAAQINSPSKVAYKIGDSFGLGFVNGINDMNGNSYKAGREIATKAKEGLNQAIKNINRYIDSGLDTNPVIRPVLDLSEISSKSTALNSMLSNGMAMAISSDLNNNSAKIQNGNLIGSESSNGLYSVNYVQNNYSPKSLSRIDIYRQTKNQLTSFKRMVQA